MSDYAKKADALHHKGYNCAQAVTCAFAEELNRDEKELFQIMEGFGLGMGAMETCGAVSAMAAVVGMKISDGNLEKPGTKKICYRTAKALVEEFRKKNGSVICRELKGVDTKVPLRKCDDCVKDAADIVAAFLNGELEV